MYVPSETQGAPKERSASDARLQKIQRNRSQSAETMSLMNEQTTAKKEPPRSSTPGYHDIMKLP